jgi:MtN3 and saliva related transmembrane protein
MALATILGLLAAACTTGSFLPQLIKTWKTRETKDLSLVMYVILALGLLLWIVYGVMVNDNILIVANSVSICLVSTVLYLKIRHG